MNQRHNAPNVAADSANWNESSVGQFYGSRERSHKEAGYDTISADWKRISIVRRASITKGVVTHWPIFASNRTCYAVRDVKLQISTKLGNLILHLQ